MKIDEMVKVGTKKTNTEVGQTKSLMYNNYFLFQKQMLLKKEANVRVGPAVEEKTLK